MHVYVCVLYMDTQYVTCMNMCGCNVCFGDSATMQLLK